MAPKKKRPPANNKSAAREKPTRRRRKRHLKPMVIPEPEPNTRAVFVFAGPPGVPFMVGDPPGNVVMDCGSCGNVLTDGVGVEQLQGIVIKCPKCGSFNDTLA